MDDNRFRMRDDDASPHRRHKRIFIRLVMLAAVILFVAIYADLALM